MIFTSYFLDIFGSYVRPNICAPQKNCKNAVNNFFRCLMIDLTPKLETCNVQTIIALLTFNEFVSRLNIELYLSY
jgi:hypothetical protein